jgi:predicted nuclease of predicted toxin-antitoxin system
VRFSRFEQCTTKSIGQVNGNPIPGDLAILEHAHREKQILVTLDKDFGELSIVKGHPHFGIIRLLGFSVLEMAPVILEIIERHETALLAGAIIVATPSKIRIRLSE